MSEMDGPLQLGDRPQPSVRASDGDRERVATLLRDKYADGRITFDELQERLDLAYNSKTMSELTTFIR